MIQTKKQALVFVVFSICVISLLLGMLGCGETGSPVPNIAPETSLPGSTPPEGGSNVHHVEIFFSGADLDGTIAYYEYIVDSYADNVDSRDDITVVSPAATDGRWTRSNTAFVNLVLSADVLRADPRGDIGSGEFDRWHTFHVRAVDNEGGFDATPSHVTFRAFTLAPKIWLNTPASAGQNLTLPTTFVMNWEGFDPIGNGNTQDIGDARWTMQEVTLDGTGMPIGYPEALYDLPPGEWSNWFAWNDPDSLGKEAVMRDVILQGAPDKSYVFAVQGRDDGGAITPQFMNENFEENNFAVLTVTSNLRNGPAITVSANDGDIGTWEIDGMGEPPIQAVTTTDSVFVSWSSMRTSQYGANRGEYRFGWNLVDPGSDDEWTEWEPALFAAPLRIVAAGISEFRLQARDNIGQVTEVVIDFIRQ